jgi:alpha-tubulin suppressor-like RCC1 family protein
VENLAGVSALSASGTHVLALRVDGTLRAWGDNSYGQIGNGGSRRDVKTPVLVREPFAEDATATRFTGATAIATGAYVSFALREDGTVWNWGSEIDGVIGTGGLQTTRPLQIPGLTGVTAIAAGPGFALALLADGTVRAWGDNSHGQLGTGDTRDRSAPVPVPGLTDVVQIDAGGYHSVARTRTGQVKTWGGNDGGQLGDSTTTNRTRPVTALGLTGITDITAGLENTFAVRADRSVVGWGSNYVRQLGIDGPAVTTPRPLPRLGAVTDIDAGHNYSLLLR